MNYFDHPPVIALLIRITTLNMLLQQEIFLRCGAVLSAAAGTLLSYSIGKKIKNERTGWFASLLYTCSIYSSIIAGVFIIPDSPQIVFWLLGLRIALNFATDNHNYPTAKTWVIWGVFTGICIMCKVHGLFLWIGLGLYILSYKRHFLLQRFLYISLFITILIISPILIWNWQNNFVTWNYHSARVAVHATKINIDTFIQGILGQVAYNNPFNILLIIQGLIFYHKQKFILFPAKALLLL
jgi:4-amino-4-deoxy-L-arabinose transferase-like glycosyltransferase